MLSLPGGAFVLRDADTVRRQVALRISGAACRGGSSFNTEGSLKKILSAALGLCTTTVVLAATALPVMFSSQALGAVGASGKALTDVQIETMTPVAQAALLDPLRAVAGALSDVGRGSGARVFTSVGIDANHDVVNLYLTDTRRATGFVQAAKSMESSIDTKQIRIHKATYTLAALDVAREAYLAKPHPYAVYAVSPAPDGSGLQIEVDNTATAIKADGNNVAIKPISTAKTHVVSAASTVPTVTRSFTKGFARHVKSAVWNNVKWHDSPPFIGGDVITDGTGHCTAGLPAVRKSDGYPVMVTAAHCFAVGQRIYTAAGTTWSWSNGLLGNYVGTVTSRNTGWDAELLVGADNNADESDVDGWIPMTSVQYSYLGDWVCHSGARSASLGHSTPCGIKVTNQDLWFPIAGYHARGVEGVDVVNGWGSVNGDSGGTVWAATGNANARQARGIISDGGLDGTPDQKRVDWTEAIDIFNAYGLKLNPVK